MIRFSILIIVFFSIGFTFSTNAQITTQQARPIDSSLVSWYMEVGIIHTTNYHDLLPPLEGVFTWDAGSGANTTIEDFYIAWSHTGRVADTLAVCIDTMPGQAYKLFNLDEMTNTSAYQDSVELWLKNLGLTVSLQHYKCMSLKIWPNPITSNFFNFSLPASSKYRLVVQDLFGNKIKESSGQGKKGEVICIEFEFVRGIYLFSLFIDGNIYTIKIAKI